LPVGRKRQGRYALPFGRAKPCLKKNKVAMDIPALPMEAEKQDLA
jgi:hypothetical protein